MITEPPIKNGIPNINSKYRPMYATNPHINNQQNHQHPSNRQIVISQYHTSNPLQTSVSPQVPNNSQVPATQHHTQQISSVQSAPPVQQVSSAGLAPYSDSQISGSQQTVNHSHQTSIHQQTSVTSFQSNSNVQLTSNAQQPPANQQPSNSIPPSIVQPPVRSCIIVFNPKISPLIISSISNSDFIVVEINSFVFASAYSHPVTPIEPTIECLNDLMTYVSNKKLFITGDFNAKSIFWGPSSDDRGEKLLAAVIHHDLTILNDGVRPTFDTVRGNRRLTSFIDLTITTSNVADNISNWSVEDDIHNSDHQPILTTIANNNLRSFVSESTVKWNTNNVNWPDWATEIDKKLTEYAINENNISSIDNEQHLDLTISIFTSAVQQACNKCCSKYVMSDQKRLYRKIRRCYNPLTLQRYKQEYLVLRQQYRARSRKVKSDAFNNHINGEGPVNCFQKVCRLMKNSGHIITKTIEGASDPVESTTKLVNALFPSDDEENDSDDQKSVRHYINNWLQKNNNISPPPPITMNELHNAIIKFKEGKAPGYDVYNLNRQIESALTTNEYVALISLDIRGAFDHAWHPFIIDQLINYRTPKYLIKMMANYQNDRRICASYGGVTCCKSTNRGVVQGSMLGPLNWNIVINDLLTRNIGPDAVMQAYADDVAIVVSSKCKTFMAIKINNILKIAYDWGIKTKLTFSENKTQIMYISKRINIPTCFPVKMNNIEIKPVDQIKILGVIFNKQLDFRPHMRYAIAKATNVYRLVMNIARKSYGLSPSVLQSIYHSFIEPIVAYGAVVTHKAVRYQHMINSLRQLQKPMAQITTKAYRTAPAVAILAIADFPPLHMFINQRADIVKARVTKEYVHEDSTIAVDIDDLKDMNIEPQVNIIVRQPTAMPPTRIHTKSIITNLGIGTAFIIFRQNNPILIRSYRLPKYCSLQQADLFIIMKAIEWTNTNCSQQTFILTNNIGTVQHINRNDPRKRQRLANHILKIANGNITIAWQRVNYEDTWHHRLKKRAKNTGKNRRRTYDYDLIHMNNVKKYEKKRMLIKWDDAYRSDRFGSNIKILCQHVGNARKFSHVISKFLTQTLTGHGQFGNYLVRFGISNEIECACGFPVQDVKHLLYDCHMTNRLRNDYQTAVRATTDPISIIELTAIFYANIAIFADMHRHSIHHPHLL
ncbi:tras3 [Dermatophagoides farinae]|uniref:Tras3 n=1 Tax=Dermatophagoides farinae TaxID=6954 RepID=A0A9D4P4E3_DERFA|nr:tras3 [Dermatophagoides farinae]